MKTQTSKDAIATIRINSQGELEDYFIYDWSDLSEIQNFIDRIQRERFNS